jgi:hypothetical protein
MVAEPTVEQGPAKMPSESRRSRAADATAAALARPVDRAAPLVVLAAAVALVVIGQVIEDLADSKPLQLFSQPIALRRWTLIVAVLYSLGISIVIDRMVGQSLAALDRLVRINPDRFAAYMTAMRRQGLGADALLLAAAAGFVAVIFLALGTSLPIDDSVTNAPLFLPSNPLAALIVLAEYSVVGWAMGSLVWATVRRTRALEELSHEPMHVDVFDTENVLPFGNIALATALAPAGVVVILLFGFGRPSSPLSWSLLLLVTLASLFALLQPLRGIHGQMDRAKERALADINRRLRESYEELRGQPAPSGPALTDLNSRVGTLIALRRTVGEMTTWPFRDTIAFGRAVLIALAPLIYTVVNELIKVFYINPLNR